MKEITIKLDQTDIERIIKFLEYGTEDVDDILMEICDQAMGQEKGEKNEG